MVKDRRIAVNGDHNITGYNLSNFGNVTNITMGTSAPHCHPDTRVVARKVVKDWIARKARKGYGSKKNIVWISGGPGVGKSALLQTVCECDSALTEDEGDGSDIVNIEDDNKLVDACYFFGRGMGDREKASFFPPTLAYQLVLSRTSWAAAIQGILANRPSILLESFPSQLRKLVLRPAKAHGASDAPVTVVIDALDECDNVRDQVALLDAIFEAATTANMRFVIASRPEEDIQAFFQRANVSCHTYHIRLDKDFRAGRDIEIFLCAKFADIRERRPALCPRLPNGEDWPGSIIIYRLRDDSDGQFIYATLVIAFIDTPYFSPDQQLKYLLAAPPARAFSKLDALYRQILTRAPPELPAGCDELLDFRRLVTGVLRIVVCWPDPLTAAGIANILGKEVDVVQAIILGPMRSLFTFHSTDRGWTIVTLCHKSLRDYLSDRLRSQDFFVPTDSLDRLYIEVLSRQPPPDSSLSYSPEVLMGVLRVVTALESSLEVPEIASLLDVVPSAVEGVIFGPAEVLFSLSLFGNVHFSIPRFDEFLLDDGRAGDFFISNDSLDSLYTQILSRQPPPDSSLSYSPEVLMGVLTEVEARKGMLDVVQIAAILGVQPSLVEGIIFGPAKVLFRLDSFGNVHFSAYLFEEFLEDAGRAGQYFIYWK